MNFKEHASNRAKSAASQALSRIAPEPNFYRAMLDALTDEDADVMQELKPPQWLSGEWAGESLTEIFGYEPTDEECHEYEAWADLVYWAELAALCKVSASPTSRYVLTVRFNCDDPEWAQRIRNVVDENFNEDHLCSYVETTLEPE